MRKPLWKSVLVLVAGLAAAGCEGDSTAPGAALSLAAYYPFDGDASDASGNGNDARVFGTTAAPDRAGNRDAALAFDGVDDYLDTGTTFDFAPRTVAFWFRLREHLPRYQRVLVQNSHRLEYGAFGVGVTPDHRLEGRAGGNGSFLFGPTIEADRWYHIALVREDSLELYYVDGTFVAESTGSPGGSVSDNMHLMVGTTRIPDRFFGGAIDELRIYEAALSPENVMRLYRGQEPVAPH